MYVSRFSGNMILSFSDDNYCHLVNVCIAFSDDMYFQFNENCHKFAVHSAVNEVGNNFDNLLKSKYNLF